MAEKKLELPIAIQENLQLLSAVLADKNSLDENEKLTLAEFLVSCMHNPKMNAQVLAANESLVAKGINPKGVDIVLNLHFWTRNLDAYETAMAAFNNKMSLTKVEVVSHFAVLNNLGQHLATDFTHLQELGLLIDKKRTLQDLHTKIIASRQVIDMVNKNAQRIESYTPSLFGQETAHQHILGFFIRVNQLSIGPQPRHP